MTTANKVSKYFSFNHYSSGQALLIVLLSMAVVLTVVLSILSTSITDVAVTSREEESLRAFSAAEAGVEKALIVGQSQGTVDLGQSTYTINVRNTAEGKTFFEYPQELASGESANVWLVSHDANGNLSCSGVPCFTGDRLRFCWGNKGQAADATAPAVEISVYYLNTPGNYSSTRVARAVLDPNASRTAANKFSAATNSSCTLGSTDYAFQTTLTWASLGVPATVYTVNNGLQFVSVRMFYNTVPQKIGFDANFAGLSTLPSQGKTIESVGNAGEATRKIEVVNLYRQPPSIFTSAVFGAGGLNP